MNETRSDEMQICFFHNGEGRRILGGNPIALEVQGGAPQRVQIFS